MVRRNQSKKSDLATKLNLIHTQAAGIDVGATFHVVAVSPEPQPVPTSQRVTGDLYRLANWLVEIGATTVAMESIGIYWILVFDILETHGLEVLLVNARHFKNVPGRKTDVSEAQWSQQLHAYGLLRGSFQPAQESAALVTYREARCQASEETIREALTGHDCSEHVFALRQSLDLYDSYQARIDVCDQEIELTLKSLQDDTILKHYPLRANITAV